MSLPIIREKNIIMKTKKTNGNLSPDEWEYYLAPLRPFFIKVTQFFVKLFKIKERNIRKDFFQFKKNSWEKEREYKEQIKQLKEENKKLNLSVKHLSSLLPRVDWENDYMRAQTSLHITMSEGFLRSTNPRQLTDYVFKEISKKLVLKKMENFQPLNRIVK